MHANLTYEKFKQLAKSKKLEDFEKVGFNKEMRAGYEFVILNDIINKLGISKRTEKANILDIGCGCSALTLSLIQYFKENGHLLSLCDSMEMLNELPLLNVQEYGHCIRKVPGKFPDQLPQFIDDNRGAFDAILCYSVIQYVILGHDSLEVFLNGMNELLVNGGIILIGDIPNKDKRAKYFKTEKGRERHLEYLKCNNLPLDFAIGEPVDNILEEDVERISYYFQNKGYEVQRVEQNELLPTFGKREDLIIKKP